MKLANNSLTAEVYNDLKNWLSISHGKFIPIISLVIISIVKKNESFLVYAFLYGFFAFFAHLYQQNLIDAVEEKFGDDSEIEKEEFFSLLYNEINSKTIAGRLTTTIVFVSLISISIWYLVSTKTLVEITLNHFPPIYTKREDIAIFSIFTILSMSQILWMTYVIFPYLDDKASEVMYEWIVYVKED